MIYQGKARHQVRGVVLHCAGVPTGWANGKTADQARAIIDQWHKDKGWRGIGYHAVIMPDGSYCVGRPWVEIGAHCKEANAGTLGFLMVEARQVTGITKAPDWFTDAQLDQCEKLIKGVPGLEWIKGHNEWAPKMCPGFYIDVDVAPGWTRHMRDDLS